MMIPRMNNTSDILPTPDAPTIQTNENTEATKKLNNKPKQNKKWSLIQHWERASRAKQVKWILEAVAVIIALSMLGVYVCDYYQRETQFSIEHRPKIIFSRPPEFVVYPGPQELPGMVACKILDNGVGFQTGTFHLWIKNIGNEDALGVFIFPNVKIVPEQKTGEPTFDDPPSITDTTCKNPGKPPKNLFPVYRGKEIEIPIRQVTETYSLEKKIASGTKFSLYAAFCINYTDGSGKPYGSCRTYRMTVNGQKGSLNPFSFFCDGNTFIGDFQPTFSDYCEN
jgi:hypothetical protein